METQRPKIGVGAIILKDGKVLMQRRKNAHGEGCWSFPGGHLEWNESPEECAARETVEEMGVIISNAKSVTFTNDISPSEETHYVTLFVVSDWLSGEPQIMEPDKASEFGWFTWEEMPQPLFLPIQNLLKQDFRP